MGVNAIYVLVADESVFLQTVVFGSPFTMPIAILIASGFSWVVCQGWLGGHRLDVAGHDPTNHHLGWAAANQETVA